MLRWLVRRNTFNESSVVEGLVGDGNESRCCVGVSRCRCFDGVTVLAPGVGQAMPGRSAARGQRGSARIVQLDKEQRSECETNGQKNVHPGGARHFHLFTV